MAQASSLFSSKKTTLGHQQWHNKCCVVVCTITEFHGGKWHLMEQWCFSLACQCSGLGCSLQLKGIFKMCSSLEDWLQCTSFPHTYLVSLKRAARFLPRTRSGQKLCSSSAYPQKSQNKVYYEPTTS